jgi:hypothetical protein
MSLPGIEPVVLAPEQDEVTIDGKKFKLLEPMAAGFATYSDLSQDIGDKFILVSGDLSKRAIGLLDDNRAAPVAQEELDALREEVRKARETIDNSELVAFVLNVHPDNMRVDADFVKTKMAYSMRKKVLAIMNRICDLDGMEKNPLSLFFPAIGMLPAMLGKKMNG